jgi:hypothetical protein
MDPRPLVLTAEHVAAVSERQAGESRRLVDALRALRSPRSVVEGALAESIAWREGMTVDLEALLTGADTAALEARLAKTIAALL